MPRRTPKNLDAVKACLVSFLVTSGCVHSQIGLETRIGTRVAPEVDAASSASKSESAGAAGATKDPAVRPVVALQPGERTEAATKTDQPTPLPPAINADFRGPENNQPFYSCHGYRKAKTMGRFPSHGMGVDSQSMAASRRMGLWLLCSKVTVIRSCWISTVPPVSTKRR